MSIFLEEKESEDGGGGAVGPWAGGPWAGTPLALGRGSPDWAPRAPCCVAIETFGTETCKAR